MKCKILPCTPENLAAHRAWMESSGDQPIEAADAWIFVTAESSTGRISPAAGAALFVRPDHVLFTALRSEIYLDMPQAVALSRVIVGAAMTFSTAVGRQLRVPVFSDGIAELLASHGFQMAGPALPGLMFVEPGIGPFEVAVAQKQEPAPTAREPLGPVGKETAKPNRRVRRAAAAAKRR